MIFLIIEREKRTKQYSLDIFDSFVWFRKRRRKRKKFLKNFNPCVCGNETGNTMEE